MTASQAANFAKEAVRANLPTKDKIIAEAEEALKNTPKQPVATKVLERAKNWKAAQSHRETGNADPQF